jgi:hypothetical protein
MSRLTLLCRTAAAGLALVAATAIAQGYRPSGIGPNSYSSPPQRDYRAVGPYDGRIGPGPNDRDRYDRARHDHDRYDNDRHDHDWHDDHDDHDWHGGPGPNRPGPNRNVDVRSYGPAGVVVDYGPGKVIVGPKSVIVASDNGRNNGVQYGVHLIAPTTMRSRGTYIRQSFNDRNTFSPRWYESHRTAWQPTRYVGNNVYGSVSYNSLSQFCRLPNRPVYYDYGSTVVYNGDMVYVNGSPTVEINSYFDQAAALAERGRLQPPNPT